MVQFLSEQRIGALLGEPSEKLINCVLSSCALVTGTAKVDGQRSFLSRGMCRISRTRAADAGVELYRRELGLNGADVGEDLRRRQTFAMMGKLTSAEPVMLKFPADRVHCPVPSRVLHRETGSRGASKPPPYKRSKMENDRGMYPEARCSFRLQSLRSSRSLCRVV